MKRNASIAFGFICLIISLLIGTWCYGQTLPKDADNETENEKESMITGSAVWNDEDDGDASEDDELFSMSVLNGKIFQYSKGEIASNIQFYSNGMFSLDYAEEHKDDSSNLYPNGSVSFMEYAGAYSGCTELNDYSVSISVSFLEPQHRDGTSSIIDGILYEYEDAELVSKNDELILYLPDAPEALFPNDVLDIADGLSSKCYILYNARSGAVWTSS